MSSIVYPRSNTPGWVVWFTGISGSGKTTLAKALGERIQKDLAVSLIILDGDEIREFFEGDLGYSRSERIMNVRRIAFAAKVLADQGHTVLVANIAPYYEVRDFLRRKLPQYIQVYCQTTLEAVTARDTKRHYHNHAAGTLQNVIGMDDAYDIPRRPDVTIDSSRQTVQESLDHILPVIRERMAL